MRRNALLGLLLGGLNSVQHVVAQDERGLDAWHMDYLYTLAVEQLDPIVSPNKQSSHMHRILGGSNFAAAYNFDELRSSGCTTASISVDHSSYWAPQLYWILDPANPSNTSFLQLSSYNRFYYFLGRNDPSQPVQAFPKGFRMLAGNPNQKTPNGIYVYECHPNADGSGAIAGDSFNFDDPCAFGVKFDLTFPSCWDGINLYKNDNSHVNYPTNSIRDGPCPATHPIRLPSILLEYTYHPESFPAITKGQKLKGRLAWANGDTTGYGLHADFLNGWDTDILTKALNDPGCVNLGYSIEIQKCPVLSPYFNTATAQACKPARGLLQEPYAQGDGNVVPRLPGCNLLWDSSGPKPTCDPPVAGLDVSAFTSTDGPYALPASEQRNLTVSQDKGWRNIGCYMGTSSVQPLGSGITYTDPSMTPERCQQSCTKNSFTYSGLSVVGGFTCTCSNTFNNGSAPVYSGCSTACPTGSGTCGGQYKQDIYYQAAQWAGQDPKAYDLGCVALPQDWQNTGLVKASTYSFSSTSLTRDMCAQACVTKGAKWAAERDTTCYCGSDFIMGSGMFVPNDFCNRTCGGNSSEVCGDYYRMSTFNLTNYARTAAPSTATSAGYTGCFAEGNGRLALQGYAFSDNKLTPETCKSYCNQLGFSLAGARNGNQCYCDNVFQGGQSLPDSQCSIPCAGTPINSTTPVQYCGAAYSLSLYNSSASVYGATQAVAAHPVGWQGCFSSSVIATKVAYSNYTIYPATLTPASCQSICAYFGYQYAALWSGVSCNCGNQLVTTGRQPDTYCNVPCKTATNFTCGGGGSIDVYAVNSSQAPDTSALKAQGWLGCYGNPPTGTALSDYSFMDNTMTPQLCQTGCRQVGNYKFSGVQGSVCNCGNNNTGVAQPPSSCTSACPGAPNQVCGSTYSSSIYNTTTANSTSTVVVVGKGPGWTGCYKEAVGYRALSAYTYSLNTMTTTLCKKACSLRGYSIAGIEYGVQCYCGNNLYSPGVLPATSCNMPCVSSSNETCGGPGYLDIYNATGSYTGPHPTTGRIGCFGNVALLSGYTYSSTLMSSAVCSTTCLARGFALSGTSAGNTCRCGTSDVIQNATFNDDGQCNSKCAGVTTGELCGGLYAATIFDASITAKSSPSSSSNSSYVGCFTEGTTKTLSSYTYSVSTLTNKECISSCASLGYKYAGTEYSVQCYCGNTIDTSTGGGLLRADSDCSMKCGGGSANSSDTCGNAGILSIYKTFAVANTTTLSTIPGLVGCYAPGAIATTGNYLFYSVSMTSDMCRLACLYKGFSHAALAGTTCYCAAGQSQVGSIQAPALCSISCAGNSTQNCGGSSVTAVALYTTIDAAPKTAASRPGYKGCFNDNVGARQLPGYSYTSTNMSNTACASTCVSRGFNVSGTQSGNACFCGMSLPYTLLDDINCATGCAGAVNEKCGSTSTLSVYNASLLAATAPTTGNSTSTVVNLSSTGPSSTSTAVISTITPGSTAIISSSSPVNTNMVPTTSSISIIPSASSTTMNSNTSSATSSVSTVLDIGTSSTTIVSATASPTTNAPSGTQTWVPRGCIADGSARALNQTSTYSLDLTVPKCAAIALSGSFRYFGLENGNQCFVSNTVAYNTSATTCTQTCAGDSATICGGPWSLSLWEVILLAPGQTLSISGSPATTSRIADVNSTASSPASTSTVSATSPTTSASSTTASSIASVDSIISVTSSISFSVSSLSGTTCAAVTVTQGPTVTRYVTVTAGTPVGGSSTVFPAPASASTTSASLARRWRIPGLHQNIPEAGHDHFRRRRA